MKYDKSKYFMNDEREIQRLSQKVNPETFIEKFISPVINESDLILDIGCGPGVIDAHIAKTFPNSHITCLDINPTMINYVVANRQNQSQIDAHVGDAHELPYQNDFYDFVFARFLVEYLHSPLLGVSEMVRVCKPGGRIMLQDLDGQLLWHYPEEQSLQAVIEKIITFLNNRTGFDPFVGRKLFHYLYKNGVTDIEVKAEPYNFFSGRIDEKNYNLWKLKLDIATPQIIACLGNKRDALAYKTKYLEYLKRDDTMSYSILFNVSGTKRIE